MASKFQSKWCPKIVAASLPERDKHPAYFSGIAQTLPSAVLVFHGIGEQVRFETLSRAASFLLEEAKERGAADFSVVIRPVPCNKVAASLIVRTEIGWKEKDGQPRSVHVYEAYWAPLTAGQVSYWETLGFLLSAGWNGIRGTVLSGKIGWFRRWLFGDFKNLKATWGTFILLPLLMFMVGFIALGIAIAASAVAGVAKQFESGAIGSLYDVANFVYGQIATPWNWAARSLGGSWPILSPDLSLVHPWQGAVAFLLWVIVVGGTLWFRSILIQYVGSLVAYLSPYKDSKWEDLRGKIQQVGLDAAHVVFEGHSYTGWIPKYERIVFVAHSLGSVIAYDTINALINNQAALLSADAPNPAIERTHALITLGSPLDKTAFLFRVQLKLASNKLDDQGELRETMVCAVQPLITDYDLYRFNKAAPPKRPKWINIWSHMDIVSGRLDYYDDPAVLETDPRHVQNMIDRAAWIPLASHNQYWNNKLLRKTTYDELF